MVDIGITDRLGALVARGLDQGFDIVQIRRAEAFKPGVLLLGYADEPGVLAIEIDEGLLGGGAGDKAALAYRAELVGRIGRVTGSPELPAVLDPGWLEGEPIETMAREFLELKRLTEREEAVKTQLLARMKAQGRTAIDVPGVGAVTVQPGYDQHPVDMDAVWQLIDGLVSKLASFGAMMDVVSLPRKKKPIGPSLHTAWAT